MWSMIFPILRSHYFDCLNVRREWKSQHTDLNFCFLREKTQTEAENANEHAPYASFFKREAEIKIATNQVINFPF